MPNIANKQRLGYNPGRPKGHANVLTRSIREGLLAVWRRVDGVDGMVQWVERDDSNRALFYGFLTKLLPAELAESGHGQGITVIVQRTPSNNADKNLVILPSAEQGGASSAGGGGGMRAPTGTATSPASQDVGSRHTNQTEEG